MSYSYNVVFPLQVCRSHRGAVADSIYISMDIKRCENCIKFARSESRSATQPADMGGDRMNLGIIWLISIVGMIVGVIATETPITKLLFGLVLMGVAIHLQCGSGKRD